MVVGEATLKEIEGIKEMLPIERQVRDAPNASTMNIDDVVNMVGHCKVYPMHDEAFAKLVFVLPQIVHCNGQATTLGSVVLRLLRSMSFERKMGSHFKDSSKDSLRKL